MHLALMKWLLNEMHFLGFSESCQEVSNYKNCYIGNNVNVKLQLSNSLETIVEKEEPEDHNIINVGILLLDDCAEEREHTNVETPTSSTTAYSGALYVSDKIVLNIASVNGNTSFQAMGKIKVRTKSVAVTDNYLSSDTLEKTNTSRQSYYIENWGFSNQTLPRPKENWDQFNQA